MASVSDWEKEKACSAENQEQHDFKTELSAEYQLTAP
jgi:hypothetical protein